MLVGLTGATGFVGSNTLNALIEADHKVRALVRPAGDVSRLAEQGVDVCRGVMSDEGALRRFVAGVDVVIHTAYDSIAADERAQLDGFRANILGSLTLLELARQAGVKQFICTVSTYILRPDVEKPEDVHRTPIDESSPWTPSWRTYVTHNVVLESACQAYGSQFGMNTTRFRCAWIYGLHPRPERRIWRDLMEQVRQGKTYDKFFGCDVVAVQDIAAALVAAVGNPNAYGQVFNLSDMFVYNEEVARLACEVLGCATGVVKHDVPRPAPISSEKVKQVLGVDVHRGLAGIRAYLEALKDTIG